MMIQRANKYNENFLNSYYTKGDDAHVCLSWNELLRRI